MAVSVAIAAVRKPTTASVQTHDSLIRSVNDEGGKRIESLPAFAVPGALRLCSSLESGVLLQCDPLADLLTQSHRGTVVAA